MVFAFIVHSLDSSQTVFASSFFTPNGNDSHRATRQDMVISHVIDDYLFRTLCDKAVTDERDRDSHGSIRNLVTGGGGMGGAGGAGSSSDAATEGTFRLPLEGNLHCVVWKRAPLGNVLTALVMVLEPFLAMNVLTMLVKAFSDMPSPFTRPEDVFTILHQYLPNGLLMCISTPFAKHLKQAAI